MVYTIPNDFCGSRAIILADIIGLISNTGLIDIERQDNESHIISTDYEFEDDIPEGNIKHITNMKPLPVEGNWDKINGTGSVLLGHKMNRHNKDICLSHLRRMNRIPFKLNKEFFDLYEESPTEEYEDVEKAQQNEIFIATSLEKYQEILEEDSEFYIQHKFDNRGRCYSCSYYVDPQGQSYKKAIVQLAHTEIVQGD